MARAAPAQLRIIGSSESSGRALCSALAVRPCAVAGHSRSADLSPGDDKQLIDITPEKSIGLTAERLRHKALYSIIIYRDME